MPAAAPACHAFHHATRVYWEDTDAGGIVYHANFLKFFERARTEWLRSLGVVQTELRERDGTVFVVSRCALQFHRPARLDDMLHITVALRHAARASVQIEQQALCGSALLAEGTIRIACVSARTLKPQRIPDAVLCLLASTPPE
jgi:acyl-CoA thioester hydrolase